MPIPIFEPMMMKLKAPINAETHAANSTYPNISYLLVLFVFQRIKSQYSELRTKALN